MDDVESVGLLKIDFLGIRYLTMVSSIVEEIRKENPTFDITKINYQILRSMNYLQKVRQKVSSSLNRVG